MSEKIVIDCAGSTCSSPQELLESPLVQQVIFLFNKFLDMDRRQSFEFSDPEEVKRAAREFILRVARREGHDFLDSTVSNTDLNEQFLSIYQRFLAKDLFDIGTQRVERFHINSIRELFEDPEKAEEFFKFFQEYRRNGLVLAGGETDKTRVKGLIDDTISNIRSGTSGLLDFEKIVPTPAWFLELFPDVSSEITVWALMEIERVKAILVAEVEKKMSESGLLLRILLSKSARCAEEMRQAFCVYLNNFHVKFRFGSIDELPLSTLVDSEKRKFLEDNFRIFRERGKTREQLLAMYNIGLCDGVMVYLMDVAVELLKMGYSFNRLTTSF